ncbi:MAG: M23 family metallopeptidase, partial [Actinomycetota bacterium]|nr:M23 family metallopeptidase [Actinomycetota bacterium]
MRSLRVLSCCLSVMLLVGPLSAPAQASGYDSVIDITFPTRQGARYADDYFTSRGSGRVHRATDLLGERGWPVFAAKSGVVAWSPDYEHASAGWALQIRGRGGRVFGYYHLGPRGGSRSQAIASGVRQGTRVQRGQVIGYLGDSGNAGGTAHLHFEISDGDVRDPYGGNRLNPYASLR